jgi:MFS family permease
MDSFSLILFGNVFFYAVAYQMQAPLLPFLLEKLSSSVSDQFARLQSIFSLVQLIGGLISGPLIDAFGSKMLIIISNLASFLCYALTAIAASSETEIAASQKIAVLYLSRVFTVLQHGVLGTRGLLAEQSHRYENGKNKLKAEYEKGVEEKIRAKLLGFVMLAYGAGAAVGPTLGAFLALRFEILGTTWIACIVAILSALICWIALPQSNYKKVSSLPAVEKKTQVSGLGSKYFKVLRAPLVKQLIFCKMLIALVSRMAQSVIPIIVVEYFRGNAQDLGYIMSYSGIVMAVIQGLFVGPITHRFSSHVISLYSCILLGFMFILFAGITGMIQLYIVLFPMLFAASLFSTVNTAQLSSCVAKDEIGTILALDMSLGSAIGIFAPDIALSLLKKQGMFSLGIFCSIVSFIAVASFQYFSMKKPNNPDQENNSSDIDITKELKSN